ncbi:MAG: hypothetical protein B6230_00580 [Desulfobacteraceae bacterium 4572_89]|nr:MAG: hypothetical protein B6230_00580 [Desulfobacteraceae bacterium 4572_89]
MTDKLAIIKQILEADEETDKKVLSLLESMGKTTRPGRKKIHIEEREHQRKSVALDANINTGKERIQARVEDVSFCGAFIRTEKEIPLGESIAIRLISQNGEEFAFISEVVRVNSSGIGVLIKSISNIHQERFHKFVQKL